MKVLGPLLLLAIAIPSAILGLKIADGWTVRETNILLGGSLAICGAAVVVVAAFIGVAFYTRLGGGGRRETPPPTQPQVIDGWQAWQAQQLPPPTQQPMLPPPWATGGGQFSMMEPPQTRQDPRYGFVDDIDTPRMR